MKKRDTILQMRTIGYWSALGGLEVKQIAHGIEDECICVSGAWCSKKSVHRVKIHYETESPYIVIKGQRFHFNECIRCN